MKSLIRQSFADTMLEIGKSDPKLVVLIGDISHFILQPFAKMCPGRFYNIGICEPTIVNMAAGLSKIGLYPVVHTIAPFIVERSLEQIKDDFGYQKLGVTIVTVGSAFDYTTLGCTHHCYSDFALLKPIENTQILYPASPLEFNLLFKQTYQNGLPTYFRLPNQDHGVTFSPSQIKVGKGILIRKGTDITIVALGPQLKNVLTAVPSLLKIAISPEIIYLPTVKPLDAELISKSISKTKRLLCIEEHSLYGGVFDDILRETRDIKNVRYDSINTGDKFIHHYGTYEQICDSLGLSIKGIIKKSVKLINV